MGKMDEQMKKSEMFAIPHLVFWNSLRLFNCELQMGLPLSSSCLTISSSHELQLASVMWILYLTNSYISVILYVCVAIVLWGLRTWMNTLAVLSVKMLNQSYPIHLFAVPPVIYLRSIRTKKRSFFDGEDGRENKKRWWFAGVGCGPRVCRECGSPLSLHRWKRAVLAALWSQPHAVPVIVLWGLRNWMNTLAVLSVKMLNQPYPIHLFAVPPVIYLRSRK
jgi:hypothetical protein